MSSGFSVRLRILLVVAAAVLPALGVVLYQGLAFRAGNLEETRAVVLRRARVAAQAAGSVVRDLHELLQGLGGDAQILAGDAEARSRRLKEILPLKRGLLNLGVIDLEGRIVASALPAALPMDARDRVFWQRAVATRAFSLGDFQVGRITGKPSLNAALPVLDDGKLRFVLFAAVEVDRLVEPASFIGLLPGSTHLVLDAKGTVVYRHPDPETWRGRSVADVEIVRDILARKDGTTEGRGLDGRRRLAGFARIEGAGASSDAIVAVTLPSDAAYAEADALLLRSLLMMGGAGLLSLGAAWLVGGLALGRRLTRLSEAAGRMEAGDLKARTGGGEGGGELGELERAFDAMAVAREKREGEILARVEERTGQLAAATAQGEAFFTNSADLAVVADLDGYFKRTNPAWEKALGWSEAELTSRPWMDFVHPEDREATLAAGGGLAKGEAVLRFENRYRCKDGSYRWLSWRVPAPRPGSTSLYAVARDVTEIRAARQALESANRELEAFSYSVSHDLRAPLRHAAGFVELLKGHAGASLDEKSLRYLKTITDAVTRMGRLIDDLLSFSRTGRAELRRGKVSMGQLVEEVRRDLGPELKDREVDWVVGPLPDADGDGPLLRQVWANLLGNAVKYTRGRRPARIEVGAAPGPEKGYFVRDNGAGFDMRFVDKLFGVFQRLHGSQEFEGTGIGLANVHRIVVRHGGRIWAEGKVGEGATFYFTLP